jgi:hypothetical protein
MTAFRVLDFACQTQVRQAPKVSGHERAIIFLAQLRDEIRETDTDAQLSFLRQLSRRVGMSVAPARTSCGARFSTVAHQATTFVAIASFVVLTCGPSK